MADTKIISWNVKGLGHPVKRRKVLDHLKRLKAEIVLLQETHLSREESQKLKREWVGEVIFSPANRKKNGVAILFHKALDVKINRQSHDQEGRWVEGEVNIKGTIMSFLNIYAPNISDIPFWDTIAQILHSSPHDKYVMGGDFNLPIDMALDKCPKSKFSPTPAYRRLGALLEERKVSDPWRILHPRDREYTFFPPYT